MQGNNNGSLGALVPVPRASDGTKVIQLKRRIGAPGAPPALADGEPGYNDPGGTAGDHLYIGSGNTVKVLVSDTRQVELYGAQTIVGDKTIDVSALHVMGGAPTNIMSTNGSGQLSWIPLTPPPPPFVATLVVSETPPTFRNGALWWDSVTLQLFVGYDDGTSQQWVAASNVPAAALSDAPADGAVYGRRGWDASWQYALAAAGGVMTGPISFTGNAALGIHYSQDPSGSYIAFGRNSTLTAETVDVYRDGGLIATLATRADLARQVDLLTSDVNALINSVNDLTIKLEQLAADVARRDDRADDR